MAKRGQKALAEQAHDLILAHILDPDNSPLPPEQQEQLGRVTQAARLLDEYPDETHIVALMKTKYHVTTGQLRRDIALARELFKTRHTFDWDFWRAWEIKDQVELIKTCQRRGDLKNWNAAKKVLHEMLGERPEVTGDPRRMEKNTFYIQVNNGTGQHLNINLDQLRSLSDEDRKVILSTLYTPIEDADAEEIFDS
ncbi:MAG: hypothetical protein K5778_01785 [Bacteroidaceae bacterium]|nr:hypothetical protein [Bacteroidaceae bacterium]